MSAPANDSFTARETVCHALSLAVRCRPLQLESVTNRTTDRIGSPKSALGARFVGGWASTPRPGPVSGSSHASPSSVFGVFPRMVGDETQTLEVGGNRELELSVTTRSGCVLALELIHWQVVVVRKCAMLPSITADHFRLLLDGTGRPFAELMDRVLRATAAKLGIAPAHVHTNLRVNLPDGGVDSQIDKGNDPDGRLAGPTIWQFKGRRFADVTEADVREGCSAEAR